MAKNKALVIGANYYIGLSAIRCLGRQGVPVVAVDYSPTRAYALKSRYCQQKLIAPHYGQHPQDFIDLLCQYGEQQEHKPVLVPTADAYAEILDQNSQRLQQYFLLPNPRQGYYSQLMDKEKLHSLAQHHDLPVPETLAARDIHRVEAEIGYPCLLKPTSSPDFVRHFRVKVFVAHNRRQLEQAIEKAQNHGLHVIIQRIIPGFDDHMYTYDAYVDRQGDISHWTTCQKLRQYPINYGASVYTRQRHVPELHQLGGKFLQQVGYRGFGEMEFKYDAQRNKFYLIEINVRLSNLNALLCRAGLNFPYIMYRDLIGQPLSATAITHDTELHFWAGLEDLYSIRDYTRQGQLRWKQILTSLRAKKVPAIWDWRDPLPGLAHDLNLVKRAWRKVTRQN